MMGRFVPLLLLLADCGGVPPVEPASDLSGILAPIRARHGVPAIAAAVVRGGRIVAQGVDGVRKAASPDAATLEDAFHLGSCTKSMTATMIASLVDEGLVSWSTTLGEGMGRMGLPIPPEWSALTLEQLLTHRSGAPRDPDPKLWAKLWTHPGTPQEQRRTLAEGVFRTPPKVLEPGTWSYSNVGYALAGMIAEQAAGKPWESLMQERLFRPLGMSSAGFGAPARVRGHRESGAPVEPGPGADNPSSIAPGGLVHCTIPDWAKYAAFHLQGGAKFENLHRPRPGPFPGYAMGWLVVEREWGGGPVLMHNGTNTLWFAVIWLAPKKDLAVLVATNQGGPRAEQACDEVASALVR